MNQILFATTNKAKLEQFQFVADSLHYDIKIVSAYTQFPTLKAYNEDYTTQEEIVTNGSNEIFKQIHTPVVVEDTIFEVDALNGNPGLTASEYLKIYGREGILTELKGTENRKAQMTSYVAYRTENECKIFKQILTGTIATEDRYKVGEPDWVGPTSFKQGGGYSAIFILDTPGGKTLSELTATECLLCGCREPNFKKVLELVTNK
jgi:non-canonical purine NTP pyrophosphatase (RdgB/HAM1 family)